MKKSAATISTALAMLVTVAGCAGTTVGVGRQSGYHEHERRPGPPSHAKAYGYRAKHHGHHKQSRGGSVEIVFDSDLGVYVVVGLPDHYYVSGRYLRLRGGYWQASVAVDGDWAAVNVGGVPATLRAKYKGKYKGKYEG